MSTWRRARDRVIPPKPMKDPRSFKLGGLPLGVFVVELAVPAIAGWDLSYSVWAAPYVLVLLVTAIASATLIYRGRFGDDQPRR
jgi:hypothetical protein